MSRYRRQALSLWLAGLTGVLARALWLASHGPTGADERNVVLGLTQHDFERWSIFPLLLTVYGLSGLHAYQSSGYGRRGRFGYALTMLGYGLLLFGLAWDYVLFDPFEHALHGLGFLASLLGLMVVVVGWTTWGSSGYRARSLPRWAAPVTLLIPLGWIVALLWGDALYGAFSIDHGVAVQMVSAAGFLVLGSVLWKAGAVRPRRRVPT